MMQVNKFTSQCRMYTILFFNSNSSTKSAITIYVLIGWLPAGDNDFGEGFFSFRVFVEIISTFETFSTYIEHSEGNPNPFPIPREGKVYFSFPRDWKSNFPPAHLIMSRKK